MPLLSTLYAPSWLAGWGVRTPEDAIRVPEQMLAALPALSRACSAAVKAEVCALRAEAHQVRLGGHSPTLLPDGLLFEHDVRRVFSPAVCARFARVGLRTIGDVTRIAMPLHLLDPSPSIRSSAELLRGLAAIESWAAEQYTSLSEAYRDADGFAYIADIDGDEADDARALFAVHLVERGLLNIATPADGSSVAFRPTHPHHRLGNALMCWVLGHAHGVPTA